MTSPKEELARLVSYVFHARGGRRMPEESWVRALSLERTWLAPSRARLLLQAARTLGLVRNAGEHDLEIGLEAEGIPLPVDYRPDVGVMETLLQASGGPGTKLAGEAPLFRRIVQEISRRLGQSETEVVGRINATQQAVGGLLRAEVAALYYGALQGVDVRAFHAEADASLKA